ncbi:hypothetical protein IOK49_03905 [Fervidicoccus fontis]|uniref:ABC3 transporter permease C-terminal domain-containing protein n=1 Tax=Fervidicoccus fontis TaxID=683846 RepID=A0A843AI11_9CREN|nr:hypothetical protein [Fervidicoccus fontis]
MGFHLRRKKALNMPYLSIKAISSAWRGVEIFIIASIALSISFPFASLYDSMSSIFSLYQAQQYSYQMPFGAKLGEGYYLSVICSGGGNEGILLPDYMREEFPVNSTVEINGDGYRVLGYTGSNSSLAVLYSRSCNSFSQQLSPMQVLLNSALKEAFGISILWISFSLILSSLTTALLMLKNRERAEGEIKALISMGIRRRHFLLSSILYSLILSLLSSFMALSIGIFSMKLVAYASSSLFNLSILQPYITLDHALSLLSVSALSVFVPSFSISWAEFRMCMKNATEQGGGGE